MFMLEEEEEASEPVRRLLNASPMMMMVWRLGYGRVYCVTVTVVWLRCLGHR